MASSLISNSHHIYFESVFRLDDAGMVQMFENLIATGLLGCPAVFYEYALIEFFANSSVREDGMVVSTIGGTAIEISQEMFAAAFELPTEGLIDLTDVPKNFVFDARSLFSDSKEQVSMSCLKKALKFHYRLLHDILAKTIYVKAGSFDSVTRDRFLLMTAITFDVKINWSSLLFGVFKEMVTPGSRQEKGYAIQICVLLRNVPGLELGESKSFPVPRILNEKTVHRFVSVNENVGIKEVEDAPRARRTPVKKTVSKKRQATVQKHHFDTCNQQQSLRVKLVSLGVHTSAACVADLLSLSTQFAEIVDYIRGGDAKKGEGGSSSRPPLVRVERRPLPTPQSPRDVAGGSSAVRISTFPRTTGTFAERAEQARRHILESGRAITLEEATERVRHADIQESDRVQRERDRARRENKSSSSKRRRGF
ncbi:hypothetical protein F511_26246 [Dorcoceras hygrometricum]|uniref:Dystroglycan-like n=1 Tax=Dorcoceras hygrometricum TaxID=472368 RepID=A0A2Z7AIV0_9LAMI|nr:hypothetical protein F511_26246 [Dorcoceras hygrometricum]